MQIAKPKKIQFKKSSEENVTDIIIEPCFPGYGTTLGNALRRVLLSSLPGVAPIGAKISNIKHEFSAMAHLQEDVLEFVLKLKQLRLKKFTDEDIKLELKVHGEKEIKASDIEKNSNVEIVNPDLVLGHITSMEGGMEAEILIGNGMGYESVDSRDKKINEVGFIEIDSIYTPVLQCGIAVENMRVGKMTNWERLIITLKTDGTITPEEAFNASVGILVDQFSALNPESLKQLDDKKKEVEDEEVAEESTEETKESE